MTMPYDAEARAALGDALHAYLHGRARDARPGETDANEAAFERYRLMPRVLTGAADVGVGTSVFGRACGAPIVVGAYAGDRVFSEGGLIPLAEAANALRLPMLISEETMTPLADLTAAHDMCWLQLRAAGDVGRILDLVSRGKEAGIQALAMTVLAPVHPRPGLYPGGFSIGAEMESRGARTIGSTAPGVEPLAPFPQWSWAQIETVAAHCASLSLPFVLKGILHPADAQRARQAGIAAIAVSNIGLRQSSRWVTSLDQIAPLRTAVPDLPLLQDGGVRSGTDVLIALLAGASFAIVTRPLMTALIGGGPQSMRALLQTWIDELAAVTAWMGGATPFDLSSDQLVRT
jgi:4-hydroxymandelate oxidase